MGMLVIDVDSFALEKPRERGVSHSELQSWDEIWKAKHVEFEEEIKGTEWEFLLNKILYIRDGNHHVVAWMEEIEKSKYVIIYFLKPRFKLLVMITSIIINYSIQE